MIILLFLSVALASVKSGSVLLNQWAVVLHNQHNVDLHLKEMTHKFIDNSVDSSMTSFKVLSVWRHLPNFTGYSAQLHPTSIQVLERHPHVKYVEQLYSDVASQEPCFRQKNAIWNLERLDVQTPDLLDGQYVYPESSGAIDVYVMDTGVYVEHSEFQGRAVWDRDFTGTGRRDTNGHGTHCAGTIGGKTYGAAKQARIHAVKVLGGRFSVVIDAWNWLAQQCTGRRCIASCSFGSGVNQAKNAAVNALVDSGVLVIVSAGNDRRDSNTQSPSSAGKPMVVGSTALDSVGDGQDERQVDVRSGFSNYGTGVNIWAPGSEILSAGIRGVNSTSIKSGTSMATPLVAGAAAIVWKQNPSFSGQQVYDTVLKTATTGIVDLDCRSGSTCSSSPNRLLYKPCN